MASAGESVIGVVVGKTVEHYKIDIGAAQTALLGVLAFEGASKRNKPNHEVTHLSKFVTNSHAVVPFDMTWTLDVNTTYFE